jgi:hypothetical protein
VAVCIVSSLFSTGERVEAFETRGRPQLLGVVIDVERGHRVGERHPRQLRAGEDVNVGRDCCGLVERAGADEPDREARVLAEDSCLAAGTTPDLLLLAAAAGNGDRLQLSGEELDSVGLDQDVDDESAPGLPLTVQAVTAVDEERIGREAVANRSAGATALEWGVQDLTP